MKIGILTRRYGFNMGSSLQAFAIAKLLETLGHDVWIIDYDETSAHWAWKIRPMVDHFQYHVKLPFWNGKRDYLTHRIKQERRFKKFEKDYMPLTEVTCRNGNRLRKQSREYDRIILGSDQIWNPYLFDANYFGAFLPKDERNKIIPYAPSIGTSDISVVSDREAELLRDLSVLSCREKEGADIVNKLTGRNVPVVLDPTLMIDYDIWDSIANAHQIELPADEYILTYFLGNNEGYAIMDGLKGEGDCPLVNIAMFNKPFKVESAIDMKNVGPGEFLYLIKNAKRIITDSFHATIFSWIFEREMTIIERFKNGEKQSQNSRIHTLVSVLGCESRIYGSSEKDSPGNYQDLKNTSLEYLFNNLC